MLFMTVDRTISPSEGPLEVKASYGLVTRIVGSFAAQPLDQAISGQLEQVGPSPSI